MSSGPCTRSRTARGHRRTIRAIKDFTSKAPRGWESPGLTETDERSICWPSRHRICRKLVLGKQPVPLKTRIGEIVSVPYAVGINDVVMSAVQRQPSDGSSAAAAIPFDRLYLDGEKAPRVMAISIHYLTGCRTASSTRDALRLHPQPRGVVMWTGAEIWTSNIARGFRAMTARRYAAYPAGAQRDHRARGRPWRRPADLPPQRSLPKSRRHTKSLRV
jgi:hypothetical protein